MKRQVQRALYNVLKCLYVSCSEQGKPTKGFNQSSSGTSFCSVGSFFVGNYDSIGKILETQFESGDTEMVKVYVKVDDVGKKYKDSEGCL